MEHNVSANVLGVIDRRFVFGVALFGRATMEFADANKQLFVRVVDAKLGYKHSGPKTSLHQYLQGLRVKFGLAINVGNSIVGGSLLRIDQRRRELVHTESFLILNCSQKRQTGA